jgi:hypothetical protein
LARGSPSYHLKPVSGVVRGRWPRPCPITREHGTITVRMWDNGTFKILDRNGQELTSYWLQAA